jgi:hypothetical protein
MSMPPSRSHLPRIFQFAIFNLQFSICNSLLFAASAFFRFRPDASTSQILSSRTPPGTRLRLAAKRTCAIFYPLSSILCLPILSLLLSFLAPLPARAVDDLSLRQKQDAQERAREMARQLVTNILEVQLQQLDENGLTDLPLYREIAVMKKNVGALVDRDMERALGLLVEAQHGDDARREEAFKKARQMIREIVMRLSAERQNLLRRLKSAELSAQVDRLIGFQSKVWKATKTLPDQPTAKQETIALSAIEDQGDVKQLFLHLVDTLSEVSHWDGPLGAGAADGLRILQAAGAGAELDHAGSALGALQYPEAARSQELVLKGLRLLQEKLEDTQGLLGADRMGTLALARDLQERQETLRKKTQDADLARADAERLVEEQAAIRKGLDKLTGATASVPAAEPLLEQAKAAAYEATGRLFDARKDEALAEQAKVLANLTEFAEKFAAASDADSRDKSAAEYKSLVGDLERAQADIERLRKKQAAAERAARDDARRAAGEERQIAQELAQLDEGRRLPKSVSSRVASAEQAATGAAAALEQGGGGLDQKQRRALESADRAIERAASEIAAALDDSRRKALGVAIGELARGAETLERAAAAEREMERTASQAARDQGLGSAEAKSLRDRQEQIEQIARKVAEGVEKEAGEAAESARAAAEEAKTAGEALAQVAASPGAASKSSAGNAAKASSAAAAKLAQSAARLRKQIDDDAESLMSESDRQLAKVGPVRESVDRALGEADAKWGDAAAKLARADRHVREALAAQHRASGRAAAADALQMSDALNDALDQQAKADLAAEQFGQGRSPSPLESVTLQQQVADQAAKLADIFGKRPQAQKMRAAGNLDPVTERLHQANRAASRAAKAALNGNNAGAKTARAEARQALSEAAGMAAGESDEAAKGPTGTPEPAAQKLVTEGSASAAKLLAGTVPAAPQSLDDARKSLDEAQKSSTAAQQQSQSGKTEQAAAAQAKTGLSLRAAGDQIRAARKKLAQEKKKQLAEQSRQAGDLAERAVTVDAAALGALRDAQAKASQGSDEPAEDSDRAENLQTQARKDVDRAAANLNAREQRVERDRQIAEAIRQMARHQQQAAEEIARQSSELGTLPNDDDEMPVGTKPDKSLREPQLPEGTPTARENNYLKGRKAAQQLAQAQRDFAQAQRATGEGAEEISDQSQIANQPLRQAMELATNLASDTSRPTGGFGRGSEKLNPSAEGNEEGPGSGKGKSSASKPSASQEKPSSNAPPGSGSQEMKTPGGRKRGGRGDQSLGDGFIPNSPETTARMMAGADANEKAGELLAQGTPSDAAHQDAASPTTEFPDPDEPQSGQKSDSSSKAGSRAKRGNSSSASGNQGSNSSGSNQPRTNDELKQGAPRFGSKSRGSRRGGAPGGGHDVNTAARQLSQESWFTKLPADLRSAIRARAQRPPPRSYEDKLQRYFESID